MMVRALSAATLMMLSTHGWAASGYSGLGAASVSAEDVARYRAAPLPAELSRKVQNMLDLRAPGAGVLAPDGKALYFSWRVTGVPQVWKLDGPQRFPVQLTGGEDATLIQEVSPDGRWLVLSRDRKGEENPGLYLQAANGGALREVQHKPGVQTQFQFLSKDGQWLYYRSNDERADSYTLYRYRLADGRRERLFGERGAWSIAGHRDDGRLLLQKTLSNASAEFYLWTPDGKPLQPLLGQGETTDYRMDFGLRDGEYLVRTNKFGEYHRLYLWRAGAFQPLTPETRGDVENLNIDREQGRVYYTLSQDGYGKALALDGRRHYRALKLPAFPGAAQVNVVNLSRDGRYVNFSVETDTAPASSHVWDSKSGKLGQWLLPSTPELDTRGFAKASLESYPARDGTPIPMFVRRPARCAATPCPVVVNFHGGPEGQSRAGFSPQAQLFVDAGFIYVQPNVRGSVGYGKTWLDSDNGPRRLQVLSDIEDAALYIRSQWGAAGVAPKVGVMGGSYGGYSTLAAMTIFAGAYDAGVSNVGIANLVSFLQNTAPYRRALRAAEYGELDRDRAALEQLSPINHIDKLRDPLLIIQGVSDPRVPVGEALQMFRAMAGKGVDGGLILFPDEGHGAAKRENQVLQLGHSLWFFQRHLLGQNGGGAAKAGRAEPGEKHESTGA